MAALLAPLRFLTNLALPPRCPGCGAVVEADHRFCAECWGRLRFLRPPWCAGCGIPLPYDRGADAICGECFTEPPRHAGIYAAVAYGDVSRTLALKLKYGGRLGIAMTAARQMTRLVPAGSDLIVPVPLHRGRMWSRGYNQAALIARALAANAGVPVRNDVLVRQHATASLRGLNAVQRRRAVARAFVVPHSVKPVLCGRRIVLVDDVVASGATAAGCVDALLRGGAESVAVVCWARVVDAVLD